MKAAFLAFVAALCLALPASAAAQNPAEHYTITAGPAVTEGGPGQQAQATFTITRSGFFGQTTHVSYATDDSGTAQPGVDFDSGGGQVTFGSNEGTKTITTAVDGDSDIEPDETLGVKLTGVSPSGNGGVDPTTAYDTIVDDDGRPPGTTFDVQDAAAVLEGQPSVFTVTLSNAPTAPLTVHYQTLDGSANSGIDYTATSGDVTFAAGETSKAVSVPTLADHDQDPNETFGLRLSSSSGPGIGRGDATATVTDDVTQSQKEHTVLGTVTYEPAFGIGYDGLDALGPFEAPVPPASVTVTVKDSAAATVVTRTFARNKDTGPLPYRFDGLGACAGCSVVLTTPDGSVQDSVPVDFPGTAGQEDVDLLYAGAAQGGSVDGRVIAPLGARADAFVVQIQDSTGKVLADTSKNIRFNCGRSDGAGGCPTADNYTYHLTGLPAGPLPVTAVLLERGDTGKPFPVDTAQFTLDPSGASTAPDLTGIADPPDKVAGRTLYGTLNFLAPFAPGARSARDLDLEKAGGNKVLGVLELRDGSGKTLQKLSKTTHTATGYDGYELHKLDACTDCKIVALGRDKRVLGSASVVIPAANPSVTRADLSYNRTGDREFVAGSVIAGDTTARRVSVTVTEAGKTTVVGGSEEGDQACNAGAGTRCPDGGMMLYRLAGIPPNDDVVLTLNVSGKPVDSRRITTADAGQITQAPPLVVPYGTGPHSIQGHILNDSAFTFGDTPAFPKGKLVVRLLDGNQTELKRTTISLVNKETSGRSNLFHIDNVQPCDDCTLELLRPDKSVDDRAPAQVRADSPSVDVTDLAYAKLQGGAYLYGNVTLSRPAVLPKGILVQVLDSNGKVLADTTKVAVNRQSLPRASSYAYRLGGIPRNAGKLKVVVLQSKKKLASAAVTLAPGTADTQVQNLRVEVSKSGGQRD